MQRQEALLAKAATSPDDFSQLISEASASTPPTVDDISINQRFFADVGDVLSLPDRFVERRPLRAEIRRVAKGGESIPGVQSGYRPTVSIRLNKPSRKEETK
jgi:hypothetical protein